MREDKTEEATLTQAIQLLAEIKKQFGKEGIPRKWFQILFSSGLWADLLYAIKIGIIGYVDRKTFQLALKLPIHDLRKEGYKLQRYGTPKIASKDGVGRLSLREIVSSGKDGFDGEYLVAQSGHNLSIDFNQTDAEFLLEHQSQIPQSWRGRSIVFPSTIWLDKNKEGRGSRFFPYITWRDSCWELHFILVSDNMSSNFRLLDF